MNKKLNDKNSITKRSMLRKGFTLIELVVVIAVLGILAAVVAPRFSGVTAAANTAGRTALVANINDTLNAFEGAGGTFGATYAAGTATTNGTIRTDTVANLFTDLGLSTFAAGIQFSCPNIPAATASNWNGTAPTIVSNRLR